MEAQKQDFFEKYRNISDEQISEWISPENLADKKSRIVEGFEIFSSIDGGNNENTEVSFVRAKGGKYPEHVHKKSDAYFIIVNGEAILLSENHKMPIRKGSRVEIPKGTPHGFELDDNSLLEFVSIQNPPIKDETGKEDLHIVEVI